LLTQYFDTEKYDLKNSFTIGDRKNDVLLAKTWAQKPSGSITTQFRRQRVSTEDDHIADVIALKLPTGKRFTSF
jgi:imidazoleglycerol-phosphate dehydratase/histidinol-phosphatase